MGDGITITAPIWLISAGVVGSFWLVLVLLALAFVWGSTQQERRRREGLPARPVRTPQPEPRPETRRGESQNGHLRVRSSR